MNFSCLYSPFPSLMPSCPPFLLEHPFSRNLPSSFTPSFFCVRSTELTYVSWTRVGGTLFTEARVIYQGQGHWRKWFSSPRDHWPSMAPQGEVWPLRPSSHHALCPILCRKAQLQGTHEDNSSAIFRRCLCAAHSSYCGSDICSFGSLMFSEPWKGSYRCSTEDQVLWYPLFLTLWSARASPLIVIF